MESVTVVLTWFEMDWAAHVGCRRVTESMRDGRRHSAGYDGRNQWDMNVQGAAAELAVAKSMGLYWDGSINTFKRPDVADFQVRWTGRLDGAMAIRPGDSEADTFILVTGHDGFYTLRGWITGREAMLHDEWFIAPDPSRPKAWFVPQEALHPVSVFGAKEVRG